MKPIGTSLAEFIKASSRSPHELAGQTTVLINRRNKRQKRLAMQGPSTEDIHLGTTTVDNAAPWSNDREAQKRTSQSLACLPIVANRSALNEFENQVGSLTVRTGTSLPDRISRTVGSESAAVSGAG